MGLGFLALVWIVFAHDMHFCQLLSAHCMSQKMEAIMGPQLAQLVGLKKRQIANLARKGAIPGAFRPYGNQFRFTLTPELENWIEWKRRNVARSRQPLPENRKADGGILTIHGLRMKFDIWRRRVEPGLENMDLEILDEIRRELTAFVEFNEKLVACAATKTEGRSQRGE